MTIGSSQVKSLLGIKGSTNGFVESWKSVFTNIQNTKLWDTLLGVSTIIVLLCLKVKRIFCHLNNMAPIKVIHLLILKLMHFRRIKHFLNCCFCNKNLFHFSFFIFRIWSTKKAYVMLTVNPFGRTKRKSICRWVEMRSLLFSALCSHTSWTFTINIHFH